MKKYFTLTGCDYYMGTDLLEKNMVVTLEKDPKNEYDFEANKVNSDDGKSETNDNKHKSDDANKLKMDSSSSIKYTEPEDYFPKEIREKYFKEDK